METTPAGWNGPSTAYGITVNGTESLSEDPQFMGWLPVITVSTQFFFLTLIAGSLTPFPNFSSS